MAQVKDLIVSGPARVIGDTYVDNIFINSINARTTSDDFAPFGKGELNQVLQTDGEKVFWGTGINSEDYVKRAGDTMSGALNFSLGNTTSWQVGVDNNGKFTISSILENGTTLSRAQIEAYPADSSNASTTGVFIVDNIKLLNTPTVSEDEGLNTTGVFLPIIKATTWNKPINPGNNSGVLQVMKPTLTATWVDGTTAGPVLNIALNGLSTSATVPAATTRISGVVSTTKQFFKGHKISTSAFSVGNLSAHDGTTAGIYMDPLGEIALSSATSPTIYFKYKNTSTTNVFLSSTTGAMMVQPRLLIGASATTAVEVPIGAPSSSTTYTCVIKGTDSAGLFVYGRTVLNNTLSMYRTTTGTFFKGFINNSSAAILEMANQDNQNKTILHVGGNGNIAGEINLYNPFGYSAAMRGANGILGSTNHNYVGVDYLKGTQVWGAVWNDYAEFRETKEEIEPGRCIIETGNGDLILSTERLQNGAEIVSDTYGFAIGQTEKCNTPIASNGRVLAYLYEDIKQAKQYIGQPVCSGPNGTVSIMTDEEARNYPWKIIGTISEIPSYDKWQVGNLEKDEFINVNGRIWIRIR